MTARYSAYKRLFEDVRQGNLKRVYFIHGPEEHMKREFLRELVKAALPETDRTFNLDILYGEEFDAAGFEERMNAFPLFATRRVVVLRNFEALSPSQRDRVAERIDAVPDSMILVVESAVTKLETVAHKRLGAVAARLGVEFAFESLDEAETMERVLARFRRERCAVDPDALDLLIESVGTQMIDLSNEVDKILLAAGESRHVTRETVASVVGKYRTESLFSMLDGVGVAAPATQIGMLSTLIDAGEEPVFIVAMMLRRVVSLLEVHAVTAERGRAATSDRGLADVLASTQSAFYAGRLREQAARVKRPVLDTLLVNLRWADLRLKSTSLDARTVIEEAVLAAAVGKTLASPVPAP